MLVEGQIQGATVQGMGWALGEELQYEKGQLQNPTFSDYRVRTAPDVPFIDTVIVEVPSPDNPYGFRSVAELPIIPVPATLANALYRATGVRFKSLPMTSEAVFWALRGRAGGEAQR